MQFRYGKIVCKDINGITYELDLSESIDASLYYSGVYELETLKCLQHAIQQDMIVFEIGANIGSHSFEIAKLLQNGSGQLYCFEPTDYAFQKLMKNHALNHFTNIVFEKLALADQEQIQTITPTSSLDTMAFTASWDLKGGQSKNKTEQPRSKIWVIRFNRCILSKKWI
jgi:FkbM family methyltransferase